MTTNGFRLTRRDVLRLGGTAAVTASFGGLLTACGSGNNPGPGVSPGTAGTGAGSQPGDLSYMFWGSTAEQKAIETMLKSFEAAKAGRKIKPLYTPADYDTKLNALVASNKTPDLAYVQPAMGYRLGEQGKAVNIADYFDKYPELGKRLPGSYYYWDEGKCFGTQGANETIILFTNKKAFQEAGIDTPPVSADTAWTWDQFVEAAYKLTIDQNGKHPDEDGFDPKRVKRFGTLANMWSGGWYGLLLSAGIDIVDESGKKTMIDSAAGIQVFQNLVDLMYKHRVAPSPTQLGNNAPSLSVQMASDRLGMAIDGQWALLDVSTAGFDFGVGVLPKYQEPKTITMGGATLIFNSTKYVEEALELYVFQSDPTQVDLFSSGLWMPLEEDYYTDPEQIKKWADNAAHPAEYKTAVIDYTLNNSHAYFAQKLRNIDKIDRAISASMERLQTGKDPVQTVIGDLAKQLNGGLLEGVYPSHPA
ncbi:MAG: extracellular solute-binding protein [Arachnia sp.]